MDPLMIGLRLVHFIAGARDGIGRHESGDHGGRAVCPGGLT
jgi:hypothetical protein